MPDITPQVGPGVNIFKEIGLGADAGTAGPIGGGENDIEMILKQIKSGDTASLINAQKQLDMIVKQRTQAAKPFPAPPAAAPPKPAQPAPKPAMAPPAPAPSQAPAAPQAGQKEPATQSVLSDLAKLVNAASKIGQPMNEAQRPSQNVGATNTPSPVTGRPPM